MHTGQRFESLTEFGPADPPFPPHLHFFKSFIVTFATRQTTPHLPTYNALAQL
jgi:hypothetical protein